MLQILLVDDENDALEALEWKLKNYIENVEVTTCNSPIKAIDIINTKKPVDKDELMAAMDKIKKSKKSDLLENKLQLLLNNINENSDKINISADGKVYLLDKDDVVMLKSDKSYTTIYLKSEQQILVSKTLKEVERKFQFPEFFRVHNSYLVNLNHVKEYLKGLGGELIMTNGLTASISRNRKIELFKRLYLDS